MKTRSGAPADREHELRLHGLNACRCAFARRPDDLRKVWLTAARLRDLRDVLAFCVQRRLGYRIVDDEELRRLTASTHHEGVCFAMRPPRTVGLRSVAAKLGASPAAMLWLDGVGNPHNLGAVLRSAAHFGVAATLVPASAALGLSGAACRIAEGGAEVVPLVRMADPKVAWHDLHDAGFTFAATVVRGGESVFTAELPERIVFVFGAERDGLGAQALRRCRLRLCIPGSGEVESLNVSVAAAVFMAEWRRRYAFAKALPVRSGRGRDGPIASA